LLKLIPLFIQPDTGGKEEFSANENIRKILKVSHFYLELLPNKNNDEIKHSQRVLLKFLDQTVKTLIKSYMSLKTLRKLYGNA